MVEETLARSENPLDYVADALDLEFFLIVSDVELAKKIALEIAVKLGFKDSDIVFIESKEVGSRVRVRCYINKPGGRYTWLGGMRE